MKKIAVVDDDPDMITILNQMITENISDVIIINGTTGTDAYNIVTSEKPDALLLDIMMPELNGLEALDKIRSKGDAYFMNLPVIILTGSRNQSYETKTLSDRSTFYISKHYHDLKDVLYYLKLLLSTKNYKN